MARPLAVNNSSNQCREFPVVNAYANCEASSHSQSLCETHVEPGGSHNTSDSTQFRNAHPGTYFGCHMSCSRRLAKQATSLLLQHGARAVNRISVCGMHRALHSSGLALHQPAQYPRFSTSQPRVWPGYVPHLSAFHEQQQQHSSGQVQLAGQPAPLLAHRRSWRHPGRLFRPPVAAAAAAFTASSPSHGPAADDDGVEGELHAVDTAIRANALIFAAKLTVFFMSNSR